MEMIENKSRGNHPPISKLGVDKMKIIRILKNMDAKIIYRPSKYFSMKWHLGSALSEKLGTAERNCLPDNTLASSVTCTEVQR